MPTVIEYRDVSDFPGYRVGSDGTVWSQWTTASRLGEWRRLKPNPLHWGHLQVTLKNGGGRKSLQVHRLILAAFIGPPPTGMEGCHNDGKPGNCWLDNLRWDTPKSNQADRMRHGTASRGESHGRARITAEQAREIRELRAKGVILRVIKERFGISNAAIYAIQVGKTWKDA